MARSDGGFGADPRQPSENWPLRWWVQAYAEGFFPMADAGSGKIALWRSRSRALIPLDEGFRVPGSVRRHLDRHGFTLSLNRAFEAVLCGCQARPDPWISQELARVYRQLHRAGLAHSVEGWQGEELAAGMLAIGIGSCWIGESMVHHRSHAGNILLVRLVEALQTCGFSLFDVQLSNPHLERFGCQTIEDGAYTSLLRQARARPATLRLGACALHCEGWMRE